MIIMSKDGQSLALTSKITTVYISGTSGSVKVDYDNGRGSQLGNYSSNAEAQIALQILAEKMVGNGIVKMPDEKEIRAKQIAMKGVEHREDRVRGSKPKSHGGS